MGARSQIYVRYDGKLILARYYQWNYAERMISRARYGIEYMKNDVDNEYDFNFRSWSYIHTLIRIFDTNFDMKSVVISYDIYAEYEKYFEDIEGRFCDYCFKGMDNNDGKLLVDISGDVIKYAFLDQTCDPENIMSARQYMDWDYKNWESSKSIGVEGIQACRDNIEAIDAMAQLMTKDEVENYILTENYYRSPELKKNDTF